MKIQLTFAFSILFLFVGGAWGQAKKMKGPADYGYSPIKQIPPETSILLRIDKNFSRGCTNNAPKGLTEAQKYSANMLFELPGLWCPNADSTSKDCLQVQQSYPAWAKKLSCTKERYALFRKSTLSGQALFTCHAGNAAYDIYVGDQGSGFMLKGRFNDLNDRNCVCNSTGCNRYYWIPTAEQEEKFRRTLESGHQLLDTELSDGQERLSGPAAFTLRATEGSTWR